MKSLVKTKFPLSLRDTIVYKERTIPIRLKVYEDRVLALLAQDPDFFGQGKTIQEAEENLLRGLNDEWVFLCKHANELSDELQTKYKLLQRLLP